MEHFITSIHINEVRHLKNIEIKLNPEKRQHLIPTGKNGSGKTSVLRAIKDYLQAINDNMLNIINVDYPNSIAMVRKQYEGPKHASKNSSAACNRKL